MPQTYVPMFKQNRTNKNALDLRSTARSEIEIKTLRILFWNAMSLK